MFKVQSSKFKVQGSLLTAHCSLFTVHCSLFTAHCLMFDIGAGLAPAHFHMPGANVSGNFKENE